MSKYYEVLPITDKPEKEGWYDLVDPAGNYMAESRYFKKDYFFESPEHAENGTIDEDDSIEHLFWLREVEHLPLSREWISIQDKLPEPNQKVALWLVPDNEIEPYMISWTWEKQDSEFTKINGHKITQWIPQPK
jgi:hypothetical protein